MRYKTCCQEEEGFVELLTCKMKQNLDIDEQDFDILNALSRTNFHVIN